MAKENPPTNSDLELAEKLQIANDEVVKLREMRKEDENLWSAMESKLLRSTTGLLNRMILTAKKDKELFESKFSTSSEAIDSLKQQVQELSSRFDAFEENLKSPPMIMNSEAAVPDAKEEEPRDLVSVKEKLDQEKMNIPLSADNLEKLESEAKCNNGANAETEAVISKLRDSDLNTISDDEYGELSGFEASLSQKEQVERNLEKEQGEISYLNEQCETASLLKEEVSQLGREISQQESSLEIESKENSEKLQANEMQDKGFDMDRLAHLLETRGKKPRKPRVPPKPPQVHVPRSKDMFFDP